MSPVVGEPVDLLERRAHDLAVPPAARVVELVREERQAPGCGARGSLAALRSRVRGPRPRLLARAVLGRAPTRARVGLHVLSLWSGHAELIEKAEHILHRVALQDRRQAIAASLSHGEQRKLEVAILLALEPQVLMFDEPTAGMSLDEQPIVLELIHQIKAQGDRTILLVEHKLEVVRSLADRILVLHDGRLVADGDPAAVMASPIVREAYLGIAEGEDG